MPSADTVKVLSSRQIAGGIHRLTVSYMQTVLPGQFFMLQSENSGVLLPRPISICDHTSGELVFLVQTVGKGTNELANLREGDSLHLTGPLGNGFPVDSLSGRVALVSGGVGIAPMLLTARALHAKGIEADCLCGFADEPYLIGELAEFAQELHVATETGRVGVQGFVTKLLEPSRYSAVLCCGPTPMMKAVTALCQAEGTPVYVSLETRMACGIGACLVCTCTDKNGKNRRTCKDGPVFRGEEINFDA